MVDGATFCDYCNLSPAGSARPPPPPPSAVKEAASSGGLFLIGLVLVLSRQLWRVVVWLVPPWSRKTQIILGVGVVACASLVGVLVGLEKAVYGVEMDGRQHRATSLPAAQRSIEPIQTTQVILDMRDTADRTLEQRKQAWREKYEGRWVSWTGTVYWVSPSINLLQLHTVDAEPLLLSVDFAPIHTARMEKLQKGQQVRVSGMLWGYSFMTDTIRLSDGALVDELAPGQAQGEPM